MSSLGEIFRLTILAEDHSGHSKDTVYSYSTYPILAYPSNVIVVDLDPIEDSLSNFASVNRMMTNKPPHMQQLALVMHNDDQIENCKINFKNTYNFSSYFMLNLIDSSNGAVVSYLTLFFILFLCL